MRRLIALSGWEMSDQGYGSSPGRPEEKFAKQVQLVRAAHRFGGRIAAAELRNLSQFNGFVNQTDGAATTKGSLVLDDIRAG